MKFRHILNEENVTVKLNRFEMRSLGYMCEEQLSPKNIDDLYYFVKEYLFLKNDEEIVKLIKLYSHLFSSEDVESGVCNKIKDTIDLPNDNYDIEPLILSQFLGVDPFLFEVVDHGGDGYLPEYRNILDDIYYSVGNYRVSRMAARQRIRDIIESEGYSYFNNDDLLEDYIEVDDRSARYDAEERAKNDTLHYEEEELREMVYVADEYESLSDDREYEKEERKLKISEYKIVKFKLEKLEKEKKIIEREIETLGYSLDYDYDDDDGYNEMYDIDIGEMSDSLNELDTIIYENLSYLNQLESEIGSIEKNIEETSKLMRNFEGEELVELAIESLSEDYLTEYTNDPMSYIESSGLSIEEAEGEGMITIDEEDVITGFLNREGVDCILGGCYGYTLDFKGESYNIFRV
jgi:hypothetical protein